MVTQHIHSYNYFITEGIKLIMEANNVVKCEGAPQWYLKYENIKLGMVLQNFDSLTFDINQFYTCEVLLCYKN